MGPNKLTNIFLQVFFTANEFINNTKTQATDWEKIFANVMMDKGLISKIY